MTRREWLKSAGVAGGAALLPSVTGLLGAAASAPQGRTTAGPAAQAVAPVGRERLLADFGWRFHLGHADDPAKDFGFGSDQGRFENSGRFFSGRINVATTTFDESQWTPVDLPHDWAVDLPFENNRGLVGHGCKPLGRAFPETSIGWYRRTFDIPATDTGRRVTLEFDGAFRDAMVFLNNHFIGRNLSGYASFTFDVTDFLTYGGKNVLVLRLDATQGEGWFYEGAGIYRHVWLVKTAPVHVAHWGTFVTTDVKGDTATVIIATDVHNEADTGATVRVVSTILDASGKSVGAATSAPLLIARWTRRTLSQTVPLRKPTLWSIEQPHLYKVLTTLETTSGTADRYETPFGVRTLRFDADKGFFLNGQRVEIKGTCNHQDHAGVGSALPDRLQDYRVARLKDMGCNAYRTSHNPPTPALLDACDRLGMLVLDETRMMSSNEEGLFQFERMIRRDRNHPSVFCWSIGNEEPEQGTERGARVATTMKHVARELDPTRLITAAMNNSWGKGLSTVLDVQGFNYHHAPDIDAFHQTFPRQFTMGTEVASTVSTRGIYANDEAKGYVSAYDRNFPAWASTAEEWWSTYDARPFVAGGFVWTGFDYRGEPTPYGWPCINSHFGIMDMCGFAKDLFYYYRAWWSGQPVLHLFPHWNWTGKEGQEIEVWCFTNMDTVELFLNGKSLGSQDVKKDSHLAWKVKYEPGTIEARGAKRGGPGMTTRRETTGAPAKLVLRPDRTTISANGEDVAVVEVQIVDSQGRIVPTAGNEITFTAAEAGTLLGVGNGDPSCHESDRGPKRSAFNGLCMALVQSRKQPATIRVEASAVGLESAAVVITAAATGVRAALD